MTRAARAGALLAAAAALMLPYTAQAARYCDAQSKLTAEQKDKLLRFGAVIKAELDKSGARLALVARSGLDLSRFAVRYSHAGLSLQASPESPWAVRQLYFACDAGKPLLFDQGIAAFLMGTDEPALGYVSVLLLPPDAADALERAALDKREALRLLGASYSANAYPFSVAYQNCNQWVAELLASAWGGIDTASASADAPRAQAQRWLREEGYAPAVFDVGTALIWASLVVPWLHSDDHPEGDLAAARYRVSMPSSIESFVQARLPGAQRIEFCHDSRHVVVHRGWQPIADGCVPGPQDTVTLLD